MAVGGTSRIVGGVRAWLLVSLQAGDQDSGSGFYVRMSWAMEQRQRCQNKV